MAISLNIHNAIVYKPLLKGLGMFQTLMLDMSITSATKTTANLVGNGYMATISGVNFGFTDVNGDTVLHQGTIKDIDVDRQGLDAFDFTNMSLRAGLLFQALKDEQSGRDSLAFERLVASRNWDIDCNDQDDRLTTSPIYLDGQHVLPLVGNDVIRGRGGDDVLNAHKGADTLLGGAGNDRLRGWHSNDTLRGGVGDDRLLGDEGWDELYGGDGNDHLSGGVGRDILNGGKGNDVLNGGAMLPKSSPMDDVFRFVGINIGHDVIEDFGRGKDKLDLDKAKIKDIRQVGEDTVIDYGTGSITLEGVSANTITAADFI